MKEKRERKHTFAELIEVLVEFNESMKEPTVCVGIDCGECMLYKIKVSGTQSACDALIKISNELHKIV